MTFDGFQTMRLVPLVSNKAALGIPGSGESVTRIGWDGDEVRPYGPQEGRDDHISRLNDGDRCTKLILDIVGVNGGEADFGGLKKTLRRGGPYWLEAGAADEDDLFDILTIDPDVAAVGSLTAPSLELYDDAMAISDICIPLLYVENGDVLLDRWRLPFKDAIKDLFSIGYERCIVFDLASLGRSIDRRLWQSTVEEEIEIIPAGGLGETDVPFLHRQGYKAAILDPVIQTKDPGGTDPRPLETSHTLRSERPSRSWRGARG